MRACNCEWCGSPFISYPSAKRKYCSSKCANAHRAKRFEEKKERESLVCVVCGKKFYVAPGRIAKLAKYCCYTCHQIGEGRKGGKVTGAHKKAESQGKTYVKMSGRHTHRHVMELMLGRPLREGEIVHHIDGNKLNNSPSNLQLMTQADHVKEHVADMLAKRKEKHGY